MWSKNQLLVSSVTSGKSFNLSELQFIYKIKNLN